jgi:hypothetical protein
LKFVHDSPGQLAYRETFIEVLVKIGASFDEVSPSPPHETRNITINNSRTFLYKRCILAPNSAIIV